MDGLRAHLARVTAEIHESLHGAAPFARIAQGQMCRTGYGALLQILHGYHAAMAGLCQAGADALDAPELGLAQHARIARLQDDLISFGVRPIRPQPEALRDDAFCVGCLYTVLGSTLGGKVISRQLESVLRDGKGRRFFAGGPEDAADWRLFCQKLDASGLPPAAAEAGARHAFEAFAARIAGWCDGVRPAPGARESAGGRSLSSPHIG